MKYSVIIPTLNGGPIREEAVTALCSQTPSPAQVLVIDSGSIDDTARIATDAGFDLIRILSAEFDHGGTRQKGVELLESPEIVLFLTQDCVLKSNKACAHLVEAFSDEKVGVAFGRQIPKDSATAVERHARRYNYPAESGQKSSADIQQFGIKAAFCSNVFSAYRCDLLKQIGGIPNGTIISEDMLVGAKLILAGYVICYVAEAESLHSHNYTVFQDFRRSFDIGVFHRRERWLINKFGRAESEGSKYVKSSLAFLAKERPWSIPAAVYRFGMRFIGFRAGRLERMIPLAIKRNLSMNKGFWNHE